MEGYHSITEDRIGQNTITAHQRPSDPCVIQKDSWTVAEDGEREHIIGQFIGNTTKYKLAC